MNVLSLPSKDTPDVIIDLGTNSILSPDDLDFVAQEVWGAMLGSERFAGLVCDHDQALELFEKCKKKNDIVALIRFLTKKGDSELTRSCAENLTQGNPDSLREALKTYLSSLRLYRPVHSSHDDLVGDLPTIKAVNLYDDEDVLLIPYETTAKVSLAPGKHKTISTDTLKTPAIVKKKGTDPSSLSFQAGETVRVHTEQGYVSGRIISSDEKNRMYHWKSASLM